MNDDKGIQGIKRSDYISMDDVLKESEGAAKELPEDLKFFMRRSAVDLNGKRYILNLYRLLDHGGTKLNKEFCEKYINRIPEEDEIGEHFGPGKYVWIGKWSDAQGEKGMLSEQINISEDWRLRHEKWKAKEAGTLSSSAASSAPAAAAAAASPLGSLEGILKIMELSEEKALARVERIAAILGGNKQESPTEVLAAAYKGAQEVMMSSLKGSLEIAKRANENIQDSLLPQGDGQEGDDQGGGQAAGFLSSTPAWLAPFLPQLQEGLTKLLAGGPVAGAYKTLILNSAEWKEIFNDTDKWGQAVAAMEQNFGSERTSKALDILLNRRSKGIQAKKETKEVKGKGRK